MDKSSKLIFEEDIPFPEYNITCYKQIYIIEQWLRRIALAGLMVEYGKNWFSALPDDLGRHLKVRMSTLGGRFYLDCENDENAIWLLTLGELKQVLNLDNVWLIIQDLTNYRRDFIIEKINELKEIRNVIGHNRAVSQQTYNILADISACFELGIIQFKDILLKQYGDHDELSRKIDAGEVLFFMHDEDECQDDMVGTMYLRMICDLNWRDHNSMLLATTYFYTLTRLPLPPYYCNIQVSAILKNHRDIEKLILAILINNSMDEYDIVWPKSKLTADEHMAILNTFLANTQSCCTTKQYEEQDPKYVCHPKIWFYSG